LLKEQIDEYIQTYTQENLPPPAQLFTVKPEAGPGNVHFIQKTFSGAFEFDVLYSSEAAEAPLTSADLTIGISKIGSSFDTRFDSIFKPQAPFAAAKYVEFSKSLFSNLLGGIGYFYGDWKVDRSDAPEYEEENEGFWEEAAEARARAGVQMEGPNELFSSIPSRPFFPRGFLWDEGFHLMPVVDWDVDLTLQIIKSWFALMDEDGWIAREQILGAEARMKVPEEFQVQYPHYANPPTLFLTLTNFIDKLLANVNTAADSEYAPQLLDADLAKKYLGELYPLLKRHYEWFRRTQKGDLTSYDRPNTHPKEAYRWRGRTERHCLTSGQDDFPRAQPPHPGELHVDALAWVSLMSSSLAKISTFLGETDDHDLFAKHLTAQKANLVDLHWSSEHGTFCDATIDEFEEHRLVCHHGYVTLLPFMVGLVSEAQEDKIKPLLDVLADESHLWSPHGIRSLAVSDALYGTDENYWRGPVWMNMNYLILRRLYALGSGSSSNAKQAGKLYKELRRNLVDTVYESWKETGFAWEQYNPETGKGQRTQHFTGWTSLVVKILGMPEVAKVGSKGVRDEL
jgi:mannosyl-oligosaccharide glucosidase